MCMRVPDSLMPMGVTVCPLWHRVVHVIVMAIAVAVGVFMFDFIMPVFMVVRHGQMNRHARQHQCPTQQQSPTTRAVSEDKGQRCADEGSKRKDRNRTAASRASRPPLSAGRSDVARRIIRGSLDREPNRHALAFDLVQNGHHGTWSRLARRLDFARLRQGQTRISQALVRFSDEKRTPSLVLQSPRATRRKGPCVRRPPCRANLPACPAPPGRSRRAWPAAGA